MNDSPSDLDQLGQLLRRASHLGALDTKDTGTLRGLFMKIGPTRAAADKLFAAAWRDADAGVRVHALRDALDGLVLGSELVGALLDCIDGGANGEQPTTRIHENSANAALRVLREAADDALDPAGWRRICAVARRQRHSAVPDIDAAVLVAERGPAGCFPTVVLTAFRDGPEDAEDRLAALSGLGRFSDDRIAGWLDGVIRAHAASMEALQALSHVASRVHAAGDEAGLERVVAALLAAANVDETQATGDGWVRWMSLDLISRLVGEAALPILQAAHAAGGEDTDAPWYLAQVEARILSLGGTCPAPLDTALPQVPPLPDLRQRILSHSPRIARRAAVVAADDPTFADALQQRAAEELTLVADGRLVGSFFDGDGLEPATVDSVPWCELLSDTDRAALVAEEAAWLG